MPNAARVGDMHTCPMSTGPVPHVGGPVMPAGSPDIEIEFLPAARTTDKAVCAAGGPDTLAMGCGTVFFNNQLAVRVGDQTAHGGVVAKGAATVEIGLPGDGVAVMPIGGGTSPADPRNQSKPAGKSPAKAAPSGGNKPQGDAPGSGGEMDKGKGQATGQDKPNSPPTAAIAVRRTLSGRFTVNEKVTLESQSYDIEFGSTPGSGIKSYKWTISTPTSPVTSVAASCELTLAAEGVYMATLTVTDDGGLTDSATETIYVGPICSRAQEELDWLEGYIDSLINTASSSVGSFLGMDWASRMLAYWKSGQGGTVTIAPETVRGMWTVGREIGNIIALANKEILPAANALLDGETKRVHASMVRSFYAFFPSPQFFASGGSTLQSSLNVGLQRRGREVQIVGSIAHEWRDTYNWDVGKSTIIPWPSFDRFPYLAEEVHDEWFVLLTRCRNIGRAFEMRSRWYHLINTTVTWPMTAFSLTDADFVYTEFDPTA